jgi:hypothetical protein
MRVTKEEHEALRARSAPLVERLRNHIATMAPHQKERHTGKLLIEATEEIERLHAAIFHLSDPG